MDIKLLVVLVASSLSASVAFPYVSPFSIFENKSVSGIFIPSDVLRMYNDEAEMNDEDNIKDVKPAIEEPPIKEENPQIKENPQIEEEKPQIEERPEKEHNPEVVISKSSEQESSVFKPEEQQQRPLQSYQNTVNQQNPVDPSKLSQNLNPSLQGNLQSQPQYTPNGLPYQGPGAVNYAQALNPQPINQEAWNNQAPNVFVQPNYNGQPIGYNPNMAWQPPQNGYYQPQNIVGQQPNIYSQQPTYNQQPNGYYQQPAQYNQQPAYNQQPIVYSQQPNVYNPQSVFVAQPVSNQQLFVPNSLNPTPSNPGVVLNAKQNQPPLYTMVPINGNQNAIPGSNAYFIPVQQAQPNPALLVSSKAEED